MRRKCIGRCNKNIVQTKDPTLFFSVSENVKKNKNKI